MKCLTPMLLGLALSCLSQTARAEFINPVHWTTAIGGNDHWYEVVYTGGLDWEGAYSQAEALNGYLVTLTSNAENTFVWNLLMAREEELNAIEGKSFFYQNPFTTCRKPFLRVS